MSTQQIEPSNPKQPSRTRAGKIRALIIEVAMIGLFVLVAMAFISRTCPTRVAEPEAKSEGPDNCPSTEQVMERQPEASCTGQLTATEAYVKEQLEAGRPARLPFGGTLLNRPGESVKVRGCFIKRLLIADPKVTAAGIELRNATIIGPIDLRNQEIAHDVEFIHCHFLDWVNLKRSHFSKRLSFSESTFSNRFDAESTVVDVDFSLDSCTFEDCLTFLKSLHVGGDVWLDDAKFLGGPTDLTNVDVKGDFNADSVQFHQGERAATEVDPHQSAADFDSMRVSGATKLQGAWFFGYTGFGDGHFANLFLDHAHFYGNTSFTRTKADGMFLDDANFLEASPRPQLLTITDMSFQEMTPASWGKLKNFAAATQYQPDLYSNLEALFRRHEYANEAREVFIAGKQREREELCYGMNEVKFFSRIKLTFAWLLNFALDWSLGYGRHLERALYASGFVLLMGWFFAFRKEEWMMPRNPEDSDDLKGKYHGFWYSLDLFLPVVDFGDEELWVPKDERSKSSFYRRIHMILGHILVPLGLAALTLKELVK